MANIGLAFVRLAPMLRLIGMGKIPPEVIEGGYDPLVDDQVAVFGSEEQLNAFAQETHLEPDKYPVQGSKFGPHIDIYGKKQIEKVVPPGSTVESSSYFRGRRK